MANYDFVKDLKEAKSTEEETGEILKKLFKTDELTFNNDSKYDILINGLRFEIKEDFMCGRTGNVALEYSCRGKISGIQTSEADFYIYKLHMKSGIQYVIHHKSALEKMVEEKTYFREVNGGDPGSNSLFYLFKYDEFIKTGDVITLDKSEKVWYNGKIIA